MKTLILDGTAISLQAAMTTSAATTNPTFVTNYADNSGSGITEGATDGSLNGSTDVSIVPAPTGSNRRIIKNITIYNGDTAAVTVLIKYDNNATQRTLVRVTLAVGDTWTTEGVFDANGNLKQTIGTVNLSSGVTGTLPIANGGTGQTTRQTAMDALAGAVTSGQYLRGDGTDVVMSAIQAGDVPTLNQNTTGTASNVTGTVAVANGGTGLTTLTANNVILGNGTSTPSFVAPGANGNVLTSNGTTWTSAAAGGGGGGSLVFLSTTLITSAVANVSFTGLSSSTYIAFMVQYQGIEPGSDVNNLRMQIGNDTVGWIADAYYSNILTNGSTNENTGSVASFKLTDANVRSSTNGGCAGIAWVTQVSNSTALPGFFSDTSWWGYAPYTSRAGGNLDSTDYSNRAAVTRIRLFYASGNINKGRISLYGLKAS
jgi:hypothetical protein